MTGNSSNTTSVRHDINQESEMSVVDVGTIECQHVSQLAHNGGPCSFNAKDIHDLPQVVGVGARDINALDGQDFAERCTLCVEEPFLRPLVITLVGKNTRIRLNQLVTLVQKGTLNAGNTPKCALVQQMFLKSFQHDVVFNDLVAVFVFVIVLMHYAKTNDHFFSIVVTENYRDILLVVVLDGVSNVLNT
jgi:hypothetical protein